MSKNNITPKISYEFVYTKDEILDIISNDSFDLCCYDYGIRTNRTVYITKKNPIMDIRNFRSEFLYFINKNKINDEVITFEVLFSKKNKMKIGFDYVPKNLLV